MNLIYILDTIASVFCNKFLAVFKIFGYIYFFIKIITPLMLIITGMIIMTKAITSKDEETIKKAQKRLVNSFIAATCVFLTATLVGTLMTIVGGSSYKQCTSCINNPFSGCQVVKEEK